MCYIVYFFLLILYFNSLVLIFKSLICHLLGSKNLHQTLARMFLRTIPLRVLQVTTTILIVLYNTINLKQFLAKAQVCDCSTAVLDGKHVAYYYLRISKTLHSMHPISNTIMFILGPPTIIISAIAMYSLK